MNRIDIIRTLCREKGISIAQLERELNLGNGSIAKSSSNYMRSDRLKAIADYFGVTMEYLMTGENMENSDNYYINPETAAKAQELFKNPDMRVLFDAARDSKPQDLQMAADLLARLKATNPDG